MIRPTVGRVVLFYPDGKMQYDGAVLGQTQPNKADIAWVHNDRCVNIGWLTHTGEKRSATSVVLVQEGDPLPDGPFCTWMPYQMGQAAKTEELLAKLKEAGK